MNRILAKRTKNLTTKRNLSYNKILLNYSDRFVFTVQKIRHNQISAQCTQRGPRVNYLKNDYNSRALINYLMMTRNSGYA